MIDKSQFRLLSGSEDLACLSKGEFATVCTIMETRLLESLCMTAAPEASEDNNDLLLWNQLLADALAVSVQVKQNQGVQSENMRNYSYQLRDYAYTWALLAEKSDDLLKKFYNCGTGITFQRDDASHIYGHSYPCGGCGNCDECI